MNAVTAAEKSAVANIGTRPLDLALHSLRGNRGAVSANAIWLACHEESDGNQYTFARRLSYALDMLADSINLSRAIDQKPQPGCAQAWVKFGAGEVLVEYSLPTEMDPVCYPMCMYVNGSWVDVDGMVTESVTNEWADEIAAKRDAA
jgi:hypothetical protein